jgi:hypothetical protein
MLVRHFHLFLVSSPTDGLYYISFQGSSTSAGESSSMDIDKGKGLVYVLI